MKETGVSNVLLKPMLRYQTNTKHHEFINNSNPTTEAVYIKNPITTPPSYHLTIPSPHHPPAI